jgi:peptidoglycan hydrolase-like protein with peptidoglycan-binding domain
MTLYILDGSGYQPNADFAAIKKQAFGGFIAKSTQGATGRDSAFRHNYGAAKANGVRFAAYHFLTEKPAAAQAANCAGMINDKSIPVFIDLERTTGVHPTLKMAIDFAREMDKLDYNVPVIYFPQFYWKELGSPTFPAGFLLWQARYPNSRAGYASSVYVNHVPNSYWASQGGEVPTLLQFSDLIKVDGYNLNTWDCSAFKGTIGDLDELNIFKNWTVKPKPPTIPPFPLALDHWFGAGGVMSGHNLDDWQRRMDRRGWDIAVDGIYGPKTRSVVIAFQHEKHLVVDGLIGLNTWNAAWKAPIT